MYLFLLNNPKSVIRDLFLRFGQVVRTFYCILLNTSLRLWRFFLWLYPAIAPSLQNEFASFIMILGNEGKGLNFYASVQSSASAAIQSSVNIQSERFGARGFPNLTNNGKETWKVADALFSFPSHLLLTCL